jgi:HK97 gp10 family phage protein
MSDLNVRIDGLDEFNEKLAQISRDVTGSPMGAAMGKATLIVTRSARKNAPIDRGPLRASIVPSVVIRDKIVRGVVGSNLVYAPFQELGTRPFSANWDALMEWALRKTKGDKKKARGLAWSAFVSIRTKGIRPKRFLQRGLVDNARRIYRIIGNAVGRIVRK